MSRMERAGRGSITRGPTTTIIIPCGLRTNRYKYLFSFDAQTLCDVRISAEMKAALAGAGEGVGDG